MWKCCLLAVALACSSTKHERRAPAPAPASHREARPVAPACAPRSQPKACPATEPNINRPCAPRGLRCTYGASCCPPVYVCNGAGVFEAQFVHCT